MSNKSPFFVEAKPLTRVDLLRERLDQLDSSVGRLGNTGLKEDALKIPELFDQAVEFLEELKQEGVTAAEEETRLETIEAQFKQKSTLFLRMSGGAQAFWETRRVVNPGPERWWWFIDQWLAEQRKRQAKSLAIKIGIVVVVLVVVGVIYQAFLAPSPQDRARMDFENAADQALLQNDAQGALREIEKALSIAPQNAELLIKKGVLQELLSMDAEAAQAYSQAEILLGDRKEFLLMRAQTYLGVGSLEAGMADAQAVLEIDPGSPEAMLMVGQAYELQGKYAEAVDAYEKTGQLADARNLPSITALARVRLAYLMQLMSAKSGK
jgi:cytochrome c-type biogenesis protein CcmH/NrfG